MRRRKRRRRRKFVERKCKQSTPWPDRWIHDVSFHGRPTLYFVTWNHCFSSLSSSLVTALLVSTLSSLDLTVDLLRHNFRCCCCWRPRSRWHPTRLPSTSIRPRRWCCYHSQTRPISSGSTPSFPSPIPLVNHTRPQEAVLELITILVSLFARIIQ